MLLPLIRFCDIGEGIEINAFGVTLENSILEPRKLSKHIIVGTGHRPAPLE